jgi:nucleotide-binding universal stress UspA family protein
MSLFPTKILLATDGSEEAVLALRTAVDLANRTASELHVVHVGGEYYPGPEIALEPALYEETLRELEREAREVLEGQVKKIEEAGGIVADAHLKMGGRPDEQIVELAEELGIGLIAMGSRGFGGIRRALLGSVSDSVVRHAHCPVLIARAEKGPRRNLEDPDSTTRQPRREGAEDKRSFWDMLFGPYPSEREEKVLEYIVHRLGDGARLEEIVQEQYVRRYASPEEVSDILENHRLVEGARKKLEENFEELSRALRVRGRDNG